LSSEFIVIYSTVPDLQTARLISQDLIEKKLAACVSILPGIESVYRWQGTVHSEAEFLLIIKTSAEKFRSLEAEIIHLHPYQVPEIIALPVSAANEKYIQWVRGELHEA